MNATHLAVEEILREHGLTGCERWLGDYIVRQRWAGAMGRTVSLVTVVDASVISASAPVLLHAITEVEFSDGTATRYALPLGVRQDGDPLAERAPEFMIPGPAPPGGFVYDAIGDPAYIHFVWEAIRAARTLETATGDLRCFCPDPSALVDDGLPSVRHLRVEQSNTSLEIGDSYFLKHLRRVEPGPSHELEMCDALGAAGFTSIAPLLGRMTWTSGGDSAPLALLQPFLHNGTEGWALALTSLRDLYADAEEPGERDPAERRAIVDDQRAAFLAESGRLGRVVAEMHLALTAQGLSAEMAPAPLGAATLARWSDVMIAELDALLGHDVPALGPLRDARASVVERFDALRELSAGGLLTRIHGDLHLGQLLRVDSGWIVLDFEGEPDRTPTQRRERSSPLRDVAAMLRSFDYAAAAALAERAAPGSPEWSRLISYGDAWAEANRDAFWAAYLEATGGHPLLPDQGTTLVLRRAFEVQKAVYEAGYELGHRPGWVGIPLRFLLRGVER